MITFDINKIRAYSGAPDSLITDTDIETMFDQAKSYILSYFQITEKPTVSIDIGQSQNGGMSAKYLIKKRFPLKILSVKVREKQMDPNYVILDWKTGLINFDFQNSTHFTAFPSDMNSIKVKFLHAMMDKTDTVTETTQSLSKGKNVTFEVDSVDGFETDQYILIESTTPRTEVAKITTIDSQTNMITVDRLSHDHDEDCIITLMGVDHLLDQLILYETCIAIAQYAIGNTYTFNTSYSKGGVSVSKGVPYPHWEKSLNANIDNRQLFFKRLSRRLMLIE